MSGESSVRDYMLGIVATSNNGAKRGPRRLFNCCAPYVEYILWSPISSPGSQQRRTKLTTSHQFLHQKSFCYDTRVLRHNVANGAPQALQIPTSLFPDSDGRALPLLLVW